MKKIFLFLFTLSIAFTLVACSGTGDSVSTTECTEHTDKNLDKKCDVCGETVSATHTEHIDKNDDGICDECGAGSCEHTDDNDDNICDICDRVLGINSEFEDISLIEDKTPNFRFVIADGLLSDTMSVIGKYINALRLSGINVSAAEDKKENYSGTEVFIGTVTGRSDKYIIDKYMLGKEGFVVTAIDNKVIVEGGSEESLAFAIELFFEDILGVYLDSTYEIDDVVFTSDDVLIEIQSNYFVDDITVCGESLRGKTIAVDTFDTPYYDMALFLQDALYSSAGIYLNIVPLEGKSDDSIQILRVEDDGEYGFKIHTDGASLKIECAYENALSRTLTDFINKEIKLASGTVEFDSDFSFTKNVRVVTYEEFGAVGDGRTDDFFAIKETHDYANKGGQTVIGTPGKTYLIHNIVDSNTGAAKQIFIRTDVIWERVNFIIDDTGYYHKDKNNATIFKVESDYSEVVITNKELIKKIFNGTTIDMDFAGQLNWEDFGYEAHVVVWNSPHKNFIRYGGNANSGSSQRELIVVGADGKIRDDTPFMFDYTAINQINIRRVDDKHITIKGGKFTTIANDTPMTTDDWAYFSRNFSVTRSYTVIDGLEHYVTGELPGINVSGNTDPKGPPYSGFFGVSSCTDVKFLNGVLTGRRASGIAGTYDFGATSANNLYLYNVMQSNYYQADGVTPTMDYKNYWGIGGTNYCKNLTYDTCVMSRFDAHCGLYNGKVVNSTIANFELIGAGSMLIENTLITSVSHPPIMLRSDYGCTWRGTITIKDCTVRMNTANPQLVSAGWNNHYFGYVCYFPNIIVDNLNWIGTTTNQIWLTHFANDDIIYSTRLADGTENKNLYIPPEFITVKNCENFSFKIKGTHFFTTFTETTGISLIYE